MMPPQVPEDFRHKLRDAYKGTIIVAGNYTKEKAEPLLEKDLLDLVAFGRPFIANPDYPEKLFNDLPLSQFDGNKLFGGKAEGYTDYVS